MKHALLDTVNAILTAVARLQDGSATPPADLGKIVSAGSRFRDLVESLPAAADQGVAREVFTRTVTHDLLNPLNQIIGYAEMMAEELEEEPDEASESMAEQLAWIVDSAKDLASRVEVAAGRSPTLTRAAASSAAGERPVTDAVPAAPARALNRPMPKAAHPLLVVDDDPLNRDMLTQRLERQGFTVLAAEHGLAAFEILEAQPIDLVLLDVLMPHMDGYQVLERMQANPALHDVPVLMISGLSEIESVVRCIEMGAADYLTKPFNPVLLQARIGACLEKKQLRDQERQTFRALEASQQALAAELAEAADYVRSLLSPPSTSGEVTVDWRFLPSMQLGGDAFGYQWLDPDHLALYLFDVCGHGVGAALLSVAIIDALRSGRLRDVDLRDPASVLSGLNDIFPMELHNGQYFTMWYGVYNRRDRTLLHSSGGHPPALLVTGKDGAAVTTPVWHPGMIVGGMPDVAYGHAETAVPPGSRLYIFSDGLFEVASREGPMVPYEQFLKVFGEIDQAGEPTLDRIVGRMRALGADRFDDDVSIMEIGFD